MPILRVELLPGRTPEQKSRYAAEVTKLTADILKCPIEAIDVIFTEVQPQDWAHYGRLYCEPVDS